jgi:hypothetical protein
MRKGRVLIGKWGKEGKFRNKCMRDQNKRVVCEYVLGEDNLYVCTLFFKFGHTLDVKDILFNFHQLFQDHTTS